MIRIPLKYKTVFIYVPLVLYWSVLFLATSLPVNSVPSVGISDKIEHFAAYAVLAFLLYMALSTQEKVKVLAEKAYFFTFIIVTFYGIADELHQTLIPGRSCEFYDFVADFFGMLIGLFLVKILRIEFTA